MAYPNFTPEFVPSTGALNLFLDAIAFRDHNAVAAAVDSSAFCATSDKNGDNPQTWCMGVAGTPAKNDIIDVGAGLIQNVANPLDPEQTRLWGFAYATLNTTNGDSYMDFELLRNVTYPPNYQYSGNLNTPAVFSGPNGGHTAARHNLTTAYFDTIPDLLVAVDFKNGGAKPSIQAYLWADTSR